MKGYRDTFPLNPWLVWGFVTLTQLKVFVLVARLGSLRQAATALGVSEPAVSQALTALRQSLGDQLLTRTPTGMAARSARVSARQTPPTRRRTTTTAMMAAQP